MPAPHPALPRRAARTPRVGVAGLFGAVAVLGALGALCGSALAQPQPLPLPLAPHADRRAEPVLAALAPADDAREVIALGPYGEVYAPDGQGAWVRTLPITVGARIEHAGRAGNAVVVVADGAVYRLAPNGWTALRLAQRGKAVMSPGPQAVGAVGRRVLSLETFRTNGEPVVLAQAPARITAIGSSDKGVVIATDRGLARVRGKGGRPAPATTRGLDHLVSDRWALVERGAANLSTGKTVAWPAGVRVAIAAAGPGDSLVAVAETKAEAGSALALLTVKGSKLTREALPAAISGTPVGVAVDARGRAVIALADGRLAVRDRGRWTTVTVREQLPSARPGPAPARSGAPR